MATDWNKKKGGLRWGVGVGILYMINQIFLEQNIFNGKNTLIEDLTLTFVAFISPVILAYIFYWPREKVVVDEESVD
jgi:hypothetical protein|tara:strand:- start:566 stop:796 length:231 start_codon:yes stop_codon:yes gene_type:complete